MSKKSINKEKEKPIDMLSASDYEFIRRAKDDPNWFTTYYLKGPKTGTWYTHDPDSPKADAAWKQMKIEWIKAGSPLVFSYTDIDFQITMDPDGEPTFFYNHGPFWIDWQRQVFNTDAFVTVVIGGVGGGKTKGMAMNLLTNAALYPRYEGMILAEELDQAKQTWDYILAMVEGTEFERRWVHRIVHSPHPEMVLKNTHVGQSRIRVRSLQDHKIRSILTFELDELYVDQAELFNNINQLLIAGGTRLRGRTETGRQRLSHLKLIANADENEELWQLVDVIQRENEVGDRRGMYLNPWTEHNPYLTEKEIRNFNSLYRTEAERRVWMHGERPMGGGEFFTAQMIDPCRDEDLNNLIKQGFDRGLPGWVYEEQPGVGLFHYEMPPEPGHAYMVIGDPGQGDPPGRNSPPIMVWDLGRVDGSGFPVVPMRLHCFHWVFGKGAYNNFVDEFIRYVDLYQAHGRCGFDATANQKAFDQLVFADRGLQAERMDMAGGGKMAALQSAKYLMGRGKLKFPFVSHLISQLSRYKLPEPEKMSQDLVMCLAMSTWHALRFYWMNFDDSNVIVSSGSTHAHDRHWRPASDRHTRSPIR